MISGPSWTGDCGRDPRLNRRRWRKGFAGGWWVVCPTGRPSTYNNHGTRHLGALIVASDVDKNCLFERRRYCRFVFDSIVFCHFLYFSYILYYIPDCFNTFYLSFSIFHIKIHTKHVQLSLVIKTHLLLRFSSIFHTFFPSWLSMLYESDI